MSQSKTAFYVDLLKKKYLLKSDYAVAKLLEVTPTAVANWKYKGEALSQKTGYKVAELLGLDPVDVISEIRAEVKGTGAQESKAYYRRVLKINRTLKEVQGENPHTSDPEVNKS